MSFAQERLWFLSQLDPESPSYNLSFAYSIQGPLDYDAFNRSLQTIIHRHETLRIAIDVLDGNPVQVERDQPVPPLASLDLSAFSIERQNQEAERFLDEHSHSIFNLRTYPLWKVWLLRLNPREHILLLVFHHIIFDHASLPIFWRELAACYVSFATGASLTLDPLPIQFTDFARSQRENLVGRKLDTLLSYWTRELANAPEETTLFVDGPRRPGKTQAEKENYSLSPELSGRVRSLSRSESVTVFMFVLAALNIFIWQNTGQADLVVGIPVSGRTRLDTENLIGLFVNTVLIRTCIRGTATFLELLHDVRDRVLSAYEHQELPFERLIEELKPVRNSTRTPLFQVMLSVQRNTSIPNIQGLKVTPLQLSRRTPKFDIDVLVTEAKEAIRLSIGYDAGLFDERKIRLITHRFDHLLEAIVKDPQKSIAELPLAMETEESALHAWSRNYGNDATDRGIVDLFEAQAEKTPDAAAANFEGSVSTYRQLNETANQMARLLLKMGAHPEGCIGIYMERSIDFLMVVLGALKAGASFVALDPSLPRERIQSILTHSRSDILCLQEHLTEHRELQVPTKIIVEAVINEIKLQKRSDLSVPIHPESLAYIVYTSGSTGEPKGVGVAHGPAGRHLLNAARRYGYEADDRVLVFASPSVDMAVEQMFAPLLHGATIVFERDTLWGASELGSTTTKLGITTLNVSPHYWSEVLSALESFPDVTPIRLMIVGGDIMPIESVQRWQQLGDSRPALINAYGPTEAVVAATLFDVPANFYENEDVIRVPIGKPSRHRSAYILNDFGHLAPPGVWGELFLGGALLARGYLHAPRQTAESFLPNPFGVDGGRLYRTGDIARWTSDGLLEFLGRRDNQVKVRGYRIELDEVERVIEGLPNVNHVAVVMRSNSSQESHLLAYVQLNEGCGAPELGNVQKAARRRLPDYMWPKTYVHLERMPLTTGGKIDRRALPQELDFATVAERDFMGPRSQVETRLAEIWSDVLGVERVGITDNFFEVGGDSIISLQIVARARQAGIGLTPKDLFKHQTIAELAAAARSESDAFEAGDTNGEVGLTPIQCWYLSQPTRDVNDFTQSCLVDLAPGTQFSLLGIALAALTQQHDALRLRFEKTGTKWRQWYSELPPEPVPVTYIDLRSVAKSQKRKRLVEALDQELAKIDVCKGPLLRAAVIDLDGYSKAMLLAAHHLVVDGVSWRIMLEDISQWYEQLSIHGAIEILGKTTSYKRWSEQLCQYARGSEITADRQFWATQERAPVDVLHEDFIGQINDPDHECRLTNRLDPDQTRKMLTALGGAYGTQLQDLLFAALVDALWKWRGHTKVRIDCESHGREHINHQLDLTRTVGWFTTVFPIVLERLPEEEISGVIKRVSNHLRAVPSRGIGYGILKYLLDEPRPNPAEIVVNYLGRFDGMLENGALFKGMRRSNRINTSMVRQSKIEINAIIIRGRLHTSWTFNRRKYRQDTIVELARIFQKSLIAVIDDCHLRKSADRNEPNPVAVLLSPQEVDYVLTQLNHD